MSDYKDILYDVKKNVATISINRPKVLNAFTGDTIKEMIEAVNVATADRDVGVLVITGVGERSFCAGGDMKWEAEGGLEDLDAPINDVIIKCPKPIIARVNGYSIGGGNHMAYFCDLTIAADHAIFGQNGPRVGSPASGHFVSYLANVVGHKRAREMWLCLRRYTAAEMLNWGLVNAVVPYAELDAEVDRWAQEMLALSPTCLRLVKQTFYDNVEYLMDQTVDKMIAKHAPGYFQTGEQQDGANAFLEKRAPDFSRWR
jgi:2-ketocyclohexanecarboxyl-CoA hydrolase